MDPKSQIAVACFIENELEVFKKFTNPLEAKSWMDGFIKAADKFADVGFSIFIVDENCTEEDFVDESERHGARWYREIKDKMGWNFNKTRKDDMAAALKERAIDQEEVELTSESGLKHGKKWKYNPTCHCILCVPWRASLKL